jgi:hypothetical protein
MGHVCCVAVGVKHVGGPTGPGPSPWQQSWPSEQQSVPQQVPVFPLHVPLGFSQGGTVHLPKLQNESLPVQAWPHEPQL